MNAPLILQPTSLPTVERPEFKMAMQAARSIGARPTQRNVRAWAELMKRALNADGDRR